MRISQQQWNDLTPTATGWLYWPEYSDRPLSPPFKTLYEAITWDGLATYHAQQIRHQMGISENPEYQPDAKTGLFLPDVRTIVYTMPDQHLRQKRVAAILDALHFRNWSFFYGTKSPNYGDAIAKDQSEMLERYEPPLLILEDDIELRDWHSNIIVPAEADVAYLGGGRSGDVAGRKTAKKEWPKSKAAYGYRYLDHDETWMRIAGMWFAHAILYLNKDVMIDLASQWRSLEQFHDLTLSQHQYRWNVYCRRIPMLWQNDGHHFRDTFAYDRPGETCVDPLLRVESAKAAYRKVLKMTNHRRPPKTPPTRQGVQPRQLAVYQTCTFTLTFSGPPGPDSPDDDVITLEGAIGANGTELQGQFDGTYQSEPIAIVCFAAYVLGKWQLQAAWQTTLDAVVPDQFHWMQQVQVPQTVEDGSPVATTSQQIAVGTHSLVTLKVTLGD